VRQERFALLLFASVMLDLIVMVPWAVHLTPDGWSAYRFVQYICWLELIVLKWSAGQGLIWRLRDEGHVFASVLLEWESRKREYENSERSERVARSEVERGGRERERRKRKWRKARAQRVQSEETSFSSQLAGVTVAVTARAHTPSVRKLLWRRPAAIHRADGRARAESDPARRVRVPRGKARVRVCGVDEE
jgi:hypothetical protein